MPLSAVLRGLNGEEIMVLPSGYRALVLSTYGKFDAPFANVLWDDALRLIREHNFQRFGSR
jgi:hypothetical protein